MLLTGSKGVPARLRARWVFPALERPRGEHPRGRVPGISARRATDDPGRGALAHGLRQRATGGRHGRVPQVCHGATAALVGGAGAALRSGRDDARHAVAMDAHGRQQVHPSQASATFLAVTRRTTRPERGVPIAPTAITSFGQRSEDMSPELMKVVERAQREPEGRFHALAHLLDGWSGAEFQREPWTNS